MADAAAATGGELAGIGNGAAAAVLATNSCFGAVHTSWLNHFGCLWQVAIFFLAHSTLILITPQVSVPAQSSLALDVSGTFLLQSNQKMTNVTQRQVSVASIDAHVPLKTRLHDVGDRHLQLRAQFVVFF